MYQKRALRQCVNICQSPPIVCVSVTSVVLNNSSSLGKTRLLLQKCSENQRFRNFEKADVQEEALLF